MSQNLQADTKVPPSLPTNLHPVVGIDLGTTYSAVAAFNHRTGEAEIIADPEDQKNTTPSVISYDHARRSVIVGRGAKRNRANNPFDTVIEVKRYMGEHFRPDMIMQFDPNGEKGFRARDEAAGHHGDPVRVKFCSDWYLPQEMSAFTLMKMKEIAESAFHDRSVIDAVITVPAYFTGKQRMATEEAALLAGLYPRQLIPEPTAAAICYGVDQGDEQRKVYLVYDLGGGTFDVSIIAVEENDIRVIATAGDPRLGGADFDNSITDWAVNELVNNFGLAHIDNDRRLREVVKYYAEQLKIDLSTYNRAEMTLPELRPENPPTLALERPLLNQLIAKDLEKSLNYVKDAMQIAQTEKNVLPEEIDAILLVGGSSQIPYVKERLLDYFKKDDDFVRDNLDPAAVVARGAAILGKRYEPSTPPFDVTREFDTSQTAADEDDMIVHHITEHSLGVGVQDNRIANIVPRGTNIPTEITRTGFTNPDHATEIQAQVYQGEGEYIQDCELIGTVVIDNVDPQPARFHQFEVKFALDQSGLLTAIVHHLNAGRTFSARFEQPTGVGGKEALRAIRERLSEMYRPDAVEPGVAVGTPTTADQAASIPPPDAAIPQPGQTIPAGQPAPIPSNGAAAEPIQPSGEQPLPTIPAQPQAQQPGTVLPPAQPQPGTESPQPEYPPAVNTQAAPPVDPQHPVPTQSVSPNATQSHPVPTQPEAVQQPAQPSTGQVPTFSPEPGAPTVAQQSVQPVAEQPQPVQPQPANAQHPIPPQPIQPNSVQPQAVQPQAVQPQAVQPQAVQPAPAQGGVPESVATQSVPQPPPSEPAELQLVLAAVEVPPDFRRTVRRAEKELRKQIDAELLKAFNRFTTALNSGASEEDLDDLGDELEDSFHRVRSQR